MFTMGAGVAAQSGVLALGSWSLQTWHLLELLVGSFSPCTSHPHFPLGQQEGGSSEPAPRMQLGSQALEVAAGGCARSCFLQEAAAAGDPWQPPAPGPPLLLAQPVSTGQPEWSLQKWMGSPDPQLTAFQSLPPGSESWLSRHCGLFPEAPSPGSRGPAQPPPTSCLDIPSANIRAISISSGRSYQTFLTPFGPQVPLLELTLPYKCDDWMNICLPR